jgi:hypothetical protein
MPASRSSAGISQKQYDALRETDVWATGRTKNGVARSLYRSDFRTMKCALRTCER